MARFKNSLGLGARFVPDLGRKVEAGEEFDVLDAKAVSFVAGGFEPVDAAAKRAQAELAETPDGAADEPAEKPDGAADEPAAEPEDTTDEEGGD